MDDPRLTESQKNLILEIMYNNKKNANKGAPLSQVMSDFIDQKKAEYQKALEKSIVGDIQSQQEILKTYKSQVKALEGFVKQHQKNLENKKELVKSLEDIDFDSAAYEELKKLKEQLEIYKHAEIICNAPSKLLTDFEKNHNYTKLRTEFSALHRFLEKKKTNYPIFRAAFVELSTLASKITSIANAGMADDNDLSSFVEAANLFVEVLTAYPQPDHPRPVEEVSAQAEWRLLFVELPRIGNPRIKSISDAITFSNNVVKLLGRFSIHADTKDSEIITKTERLSGAVRECFARVTAAVETAVTETAALTSDDFNGLSECGIAWRQFRCDQGAFAVAACRAALECAGSDKGNVLAMLANSGDRSVLERVRNNASLFYGSLAGEPVGLEGMEDFCNRMSTHAKRVVPVLSTDRAVQAALLGQIHAAVAAQARAASLELSRGLFVCSDFAEGFRAVHAQVAKLVPRSAPGFPAGLSFGPRRLSPLQEAVIDGVWDHLLAFLERRRPLGTDELNALMQCAQERAEIAARISRIADV